MFRTIRILANGWRKQACLSDNVGPCQELFERTTVCTRVKKERHFALLDGVAFSNPRLARNPFRSGHSVRPMHLFGRNFDHDY